VITQPHVGKQDDKGLLAICVVGMLPSEPHDNDPLRGVLAGMEMREALANLGINVCIGITTGSAYSGFVGSNTRREMCAMGSIVNMAARLMGKAGDGGILVDDVTKDAAEIMVDFLAMDPVKVKGRDEPLAVFTPQGLRSTEDSKARLLAVVKEYLQV
jgi:adenylate cyclase